MFMHTMNFDLGEDVNALREMVHRFAQERIKPMAADIDLKNKFPNELWKEFGDLGLLGVTVPEEFGGAASGANASGSRDGGHGRHPLREQKQCSSHRSAGCGGGAQASCILVSKVGTSSGN